MQKTTNSKWDKPILFLEGMMLGAIIFVLIYGYQVLNVSYDAFINNEGTDLPGFQIIWDAYIDSGFSDGNGLISFDGLTYPNQTSLVFCDNVPIFAAFLKLISFILPDEFQYVGLWAIICFMLQGGFATLIVNKITNKKICSLVIATFFVLSTPVITKMFYHHSQASQWVLLMALYVWIYRRELKWSKVDIIIWFLVGVITAGVNLYFLPMVGIIVIGFCVDYIVKNKKMWKWSLLNIVSYLFGAVFFVGIMGGFSLTFSTGEDFFAEYYDRLQRCGANLNFLFNPAGISYFVRPLNWAKDGQGEGLAYLGAGMLIALVVTVGIWVTKFVNTITLIKNRSISLKACFTKNIDKTAYAIGMSVAVILSVIVGLGPIISCGSKIFFEIPYPRLLLSIWVMFRSTGRIIWPAYYIILIAIIGTVNAFAKDHVNIKRCFPVFFSVCLVIQVIDLYPYLQSKHNTFARYEELKTTIQDEAWNYLADNYEHMVVLPNSLLNRSNERNYLAKYASENGLTTNDYYLARQDLTDQTEQYRAKLADNEIGDDTFIVVKYSELYNYIDLDVYCYLIDDYVVITTENISAEIQKNVLDKEYIEYISENTMKAYTSIGGDNYSLIYDPVYYYFSCSEFYGKEFDEEYQFSYFCNSGMQNGEQGISSFNPRKYAYLNEDLYTVYANNWLDYYTHYMTNGYSEGRAS